MCLTNIQHGLNKVLTIQAKHPCNADNEILLQRLADCQLTFEFRLTIHIQRFVILAVRLPRLCTLTIKHIVCADIGHFAVQLLADICNVLSASSIDGTNFRYFIFILSHIHSSPCCTMDHGIRIYFCNYFFDIVLISNIQCYIWSLRHRRTISNTTVVFLNVRTYPFMATLQQLVHHIMAQLTANARYKKLHVLSSSGFLAVVVHLLVVVLILTADDGLPPLTVIKVPLNSLLDAVLKLGLRQPAQLVVDFCRIDGIPHIMTLTVANMGDQAFRLAQLLADNLHNLNVLLFIVTTDVVDFTNTPLVDNQINQ